jgi:uncharacterized membrane protein YqgA involved in biofilm formation
MLGPIVNAAVIVVCGLAGTFLIRGIPLRFEEIIKKAIGLAIIYIGIKGAMESQRVLLLIMSLAAGAFIGELINIDKRINALGEWAEKRLGMKKENVPGKGSFSRGFISASILFCSGSMAIVGSIQSGLFGNHETLFAKSILDGSISIVFGASFGIGTVFSAVPVFIYQAGIALAAMAAGDILTPGIITEMSAVGSLIIAGIGFNFLSVKEIPVANMIPAVFIPWVYLAIEAMVKGP